MRLLPMWKLRREWTRFKQQLGQAEWLILGAIRKRRYDRERAHLVKVTEGTLPVSDKIVIQLIWQPDGILATFIEELKFFAERGFSAIVVSNASLTEQAINLLAPLCHLIVERPNFGYDFGGYREGVLILRDRGLRPTRLIIKNDSIWFPLHSDSDLLTRATIASEDIFGVYYNEFSRIPHLQSYFFSFGPRILADDRFWSYWKSLWLTDNKYMVIRQCEMKLTRNFNRMGFSHSAAYSHKEVCAAMSRLEDGRLREVFNYIAKVSTHRIPAVNMLLNGPMDAMWRTRAEAVISSGRILRYLLIVHPAVLLGELHLPLLKKDRQPMYQLQRAELLRIGADHAMSQVFSDEIRNWDIETNSEKVSTYRDKISR